jgi:hypothetical protein
MTHGNRRFKLTRQSIESQVTPIAGAFHFSKFLEHANIFRPKIILMRKNPSSDHPITKKKFPVHYQYNFAGGSTGALI